MNKSQTKVLAIHNAIDTAQDRLLAQARAILETPVEQLEASEEEVANRLTRIGFTQSATVKRVAKKAESINEHNLRVVAGREQAELIEYYKRAYPFIKFLTEAELDRICEKYGLIHAPVGNYIGDVPEKNLRDIERAQALAASDGAKDIVRTKLKYEHWVGGGRDFLNVGGRIKYGLPRYLDGDVSNFSADRLLHDKFPRTRKVTWLVKSVEIQTTSRQGLFIAAPKRDFNRKGLSKTGAFGLGLTILEPRVKDPVVFRHVRGGLQVLTKWGLEANDETLTNPIEN